MKTLLVSTVLAGLLVGVASSGAAQQVEVEQGALEGVSLEHGITAYKGIPYAAPPVRDLRWRPPQEPEGWEGVRPADRFGPRCMQPRLYGDMIFRSAGMSEDCLYLNVWTPAGSTGEDLPVLVYYYGGGFQAGDGSEPRYDGASMAEEGIVVVTVNYRLGIFGFFAHPELTEESPANASGNYGLLDQARALEWVRANISAFGGDPDRVTIAGESAGSLSVSALMASPQSKDLIAGAIGESGSLLGALPPQPLSQAEEKGTSFAGRIGAESLADLRAVSSSRLLELSLKPDVGRFPLTVDGLFFERSPLQVYEHGEQAQVPLLLGWNSEEGNYRSVLGDRAATPENLEEAVREMYPDHADRAAELYAADSWLEVIEVGTDLASDRFISQSTWKWSELHRQTDQPVYRYYYDQPRPPMKDGKGNDVRGLVGSNPSANRITPPHRAVHAAEIEYVLGNLETNDIYAWTEADYRVSDYAKSYFANFIKHADPNGADLPRWPVAGQENPPSVMHITPEPEARPARHRERHLFLDRIRGE